MLRVSTVVAAAAAITTNGNYCRAVATGATPSVLPPATNPYGSTATTYLFDDSGDVFDSGYYKIQTGAGVSAGSISVALLTFSASGALNWITATTPNSTTGAAFTLIPTLGASATYNGSLTVAGSVFFPCQGIGLIVAGLTGGNITLMELVLTKR